MVFQPRSHRQGQAWLWLLVLLALVVGAVWLFAIQRRWWFPPLASEQGAHIDRLFLIILSLTGATFVLGQLALALLIFLFGRKGAESAHHLRERAGWGTLWPILIGFGLIGALEVSDVVIGHELWKQLYGPPPEDVFVVEVTAQQFAWNVRYPGRDGKFGRTNLRFVSDGNPLGIDPEDSAARDDVVLLNEIHLPLHRPVVVRVRSKDVIHSFFIPAFRLKQDAVPGMQTQIWFIPKRAGEFEIACAELCGLGHYRMRGMLTVEGEESLRAWLEQQVPFGETIW